MYSMMQKVFLTGGESARLAGPAAYNGARVTMKSGGLRKGAKDEGVWLPGAERPPWLDGTMPGDRGYDPLGLAKPVEYVQIDLDQQDQNAGKNVKGKVIGAFKPTADKVSTERLQPYSEVFGLQRFRECELLHGRWSMLAVTGAFVGELFTGVPWQDAGKEILDNGASYFNIPLPFTITQLAFIEVLLMGGAEIYRNTELNPDKRCYPGGYFDPFGLATDTPERVFELKTAELKHGRLAMIAFLGFSAQALYTGEGALSSMGKFYNAFYR